MYYVIKCIDDVEVAKQLGFKRGYTKLSAITFYHEYLII